MSKELKLENYIRPELKLPNAEKELLLHSCCAPCSGEIIEALASSNIKTTVYFYNPNIHPIDEYEIRKDERVQKQNDRLYDEQSVSGSIQSSRIA